jgi:hypothetical protein
MLYVCMSIYLYGSIRTIRIHKNQSFRLYLLMRLRSCWSHPVAYIRPRPRRLAPVWSWPIPLEARTQHPLLPSKVILQRQT